VAEVTPVPARRRPTLEDVARLAGVSSATVSRALGGNYPVASGTRDKIEHAIRELGYVANAHARALAGSTTGTVGLLIGDLVDPFFAFIARGVEREITSAGRLGLSPSYDPATDMVNFTGRGADGQHVDYQSVYVGSDSTFTFDDASGNAYTANVKTGAITTSSGAAVPSVSYFDPELDSTVIVSGANSQITVSITTATGATRSSVITDGVLEDTATHRLYLPTTEIYEPAITYNTYSGAYLSVGYDTYAYTTDDLGEPDSLRIVGAEPPGATGSYLSSLDYGSLTNQNVSSSSYQMISDLTGQMWDVTIAKPAAGEMDYLRYKAPSDSSGLPVNSASAYGLAVGGVPFSGQWRLVSVADSFDSSLASGMYKIQNVVTGQYLQALGSTVDAQRAFGASVGPGAAQADYNPAGNGGNGSPGGSDQWYLEPVGRDIPATLSASSPRSVVAAADRTSIAGITTYKLVNRNSGLVIEYVNGQWELQPQEFGNTHQILTITRLG
jgi:hypothetical protein